MNTLVHLIHESPVRAVIALAGGAADLLGLLLRQGGGTSTLLEAVVPYSAPAMDDWLERKPERYCAARTGQAMAVGAFLRARELAARQTGEDRPPVVGLACTASLASTRPKRGDHRAHWVLQTRDRTVLWSVTLAKGHRTRQEEESLVTQMGLLLLADACGLEHDAPEGLFAHPDDRLVRRHAEASPALQALFLGETPTVYVQDGRMQRLEPESGGVVFPGSFNPMHDGHHQMIRIAEEETGGQVALEITIRNVDKPPLDYLEIQDRLDGIGAFRPVWLTNLPKFEDKSRHFPRTTFVLGGDTLRRLIDPRYYGGSHQQRIDALEEIVQRGCDFLVFARDAEGKLLHLHTLDVPHFLREACRGVPEDRFLMDISSTELRQSDSG